MADSTVDKKTSTVIAETRILGRTGNTIDQLEN